MDFAYRYRELLLGTLRFLPKDFQDQINKAIQEQDAHLDAQASSCAGETPKPLEPKEHDLPALLVEVKRAGAMMQHLSLANCKIDKTDEEQIASDLAYMEARIRLMKAERAYNEALRAVVEGASCA